VYIHVRQEQGDHCFGTKCCLPRRARGEWPPSCESPKRKKESLMAGDLKFIRENSDKKDIGTGRLKQKQRGEEERSTIPFEKLF